MVQRSWEAAARSPCKEESSRWPTVVRERVRSAATTLSRNSTFSASPHHTLSTSTQDATWWRGRDGAVRDTSSKRDSRFSDPLTAYPPLHPAPRNTPVAPPFHAQSPPHALQRPAQLLPSRADVQCANRHRELQAATVADCGGRFASNLDVPPQPFDAPVLHARQQPCAPQDGS